ncbi:uncharacterized protein LOC123531719 [Mercenaria mercenaria]|uniref:uncharacterized protein LOC123531719 n=1 Tax=Mercenaria mercenaria TaxID=6596 RepID=UPI00234F4B48|nr:uncharacterized protein LOC123531719 [Mercenaria mercenaria]
MNLPYVIGISAALVSIATCQSLTSTGNGTNPPSEKIITLPINELLGMPSSAVYVDGHISAAGGRVQLPDGRTSLDVGHSAVDGHNLAAGGRVHLPDGRTSLDVGHSVVDGHNLAAGGRVQLPDGRIQLDVGHSAVDGHISEAGGIVQLPDGRISHVDHKISTAERITPIDRRMTAVERRVSHVDPSVSIPDGRIFNIDGSISPTNRINTLTDGRNLPSDGRMSPVDGRIPLPDGKISLPDRGISPVDRRVSAVERRVSQVDRRISDVDRRVVAPNGGNLAIDGVLSPSSGRISPINRIYDDPMFIHNECVKQACPYPSLCYIPHPRSCFHFIMCRPLENGQIISTAMPCAFGTKWKPGLEPSCDRFDLVDCPIDKCKHPSVSAYTHDDRNCRTYWTCVNGRSRPACCAKYHSFDPVTNQCVSDIRCDSVCPLLNDATCGAPGIRLAHFADENCRTHWDCENGHPHPVCCPAGQGFDVFRSECVPNASCTHPCPNEYSESCSIPGTKSYGIVTDNNCRTYIKCDKYGQAHPYCCLPGMMYDVKAKQCVPGVGMKCVNAKCPYGHREECKLEVVPGNPRVYKNLDSFGGIVMPCPVGTVFNASGCQCSPDLMAQTTTLNPNVCTMAIQAIFPDLKNMGTAVAALLMIGEYGQGETGVGNMQSFWDGGDGISIPFYGSQSLIKLYLEARFRPTAGSQKKQVFVTSCNYVAGVPTFEVSLDQFQGTGGTIKLLAKTDGLPGLADISLPYKFNDEILLRVIYDGSKIGLFIDSNDPTMSKGAVRPLKGLIAIHRSGLRFSHCRYENNISGFIGFVSEIKFTKCLTKGMQDALDAATPVV